MSRKLVSDNYPERPASRTTGVLLLHLRLLLLRLIWGTQWEGRTG
jgi:hypothetical protein